MTTPHEQAERDRQEYWNSITDADRHRLLDDRLNSIFEVLTDIRALLADSNQARK